MRHLRSILCALVLAPAVWVLCGAGFARDLTGRSAWAALLLALAGAAYAVLLLAPISPAGPLLAGLVFLGLGLWGTIGPDSYASIWPAAAVGADFDPSRPGYALAVLLAVPLIGTAVSRRQWAGREQPTLPSGAYGGDARGAAAAPGTPVAAESTAVLTAPAVVPVGSSDEPTLITGTAADGTPASAADEPTVVTAAPTAPAPSADEPTVDTAAPTAPAPSADEPTVDTAAPTAPADEPTLDTAAPTASADEPTLDTAGSADEPTVFVVDSAGGTTAPARSEEPGDDEPTVVAPSDENTEVALVGAETDPAETAILHDGAATEEEAEPTVEVQEPAAEAEEPEEPPAATEEPEKHAAETEEPAAATEEAEPAAATDEAEPAAATDEAEPEEPEAEAEEAEPEEPAVEEPAAEAEEPQAEEPAAEAEEPEAEEPEAEGPEAEEPAAEAEQPEPENQAAEPEEPASELDEPATAAAGDQEDPGERTQVIPLRPVAASTETTHDLRDMVRRPGNAPGEETQVIFWRPPSEADVRRAAEEQAARDRAAQERSRQAFRDLAAQERARQAFADRAAREARERGEQTQVIKLPGADEPVDDRTQVLSAKQPPPSIVGAERPDPGVDPTTRLVKPDLDTTADISDQRVGSMLDLERPADEIADDPTRPLRIPKQRNDDGDRRATPR